MSALRGFMLQERGTPARSQRCGSGGSLADPAGTLSGDFDLANAVVRVADLKNAESARTPWSECAVC